MKKPPLLDQCDALHLRGALVAINVLLTHLPETKALSKAGLRIAERACDARNGLRILLEELDAGRLNLDALGGKGVAA